MAYNLIIVTLFISSIIGWVSFFYVTAQFLLIRRREDQLVQEIKKDLELARENLEKFKKNSLTA